MLLDLLPDLFDENGDALRLLSPGLQNFGGKSVFFGEIVTIRCFEDNSRVKELTATPGENRVLVVDGGGSLKKALVGDLIAETALVNHWSGIVVNGAVRDIGVLSAMSLGVRALGACPIRSIRQGQGETQVPLDFLDVRFEPGQWLYADANGVAVSDKKLIDL